MELKPISKQAVPRALSKAERYRLLNEPFEAESICRDILRVDPSNQEALVCLVLALTDLFAEGEDRLADARGLLPSLSGDFARDYYSGVVEERWAKSRINAGFPAAAVSAFMRSAMDFYQAAQARAPAGNEDAVLRWNACVRMMERFRMSPAVQAADADDTVFDEDVPVR